MNKIKNLVMLCSTLGVLGSPPALAEVVVGVSVSTTGPGASLGIPEKNAVALFPTTIAGETVRYVVLDDGSDPSTATKNARKFVSEEKADVLVGSAVTPASAAIAQVASETRTPHIALSPVTLPADRGHWVFRTPQHNSVMAVAGSLIPHKSGVVKRRRRVGAGGAVNGTRAARVGPRCAGGGARSERRIVERQLGLREAVLAVVLEQGELVVRPDALAQIVEQLDHGPGLLGRPVGVDEQVQAAQQPGRRVVGLHAGLRADLRLRALVAARSWASLWRQDGPLRAMISA